MFLSLNPSIDIKYLSLNSLTINKKSNLWSDSLIIIVYIIIKCDVVSRRCLMIDYICISLAIIVSLVLWWSFLAISGLKESLTCCCQTSSFINKVRRVSLQLDQLYCIPGSTGAVPQHEIEIIFVAIDLLAEMKKAAAISQ